MKKLAVGILAHVDAGKTTLSEALLYRRLFTADTRDRAANYAMAANICSAALGFFLAEPVWRWVVSIS